MRERGDFEMRNSAMILISLVVLSLVANFFMKDDAIDDGTIKHITFPYYETSNEEINKALPFEVNITLPDGWVFRTEGSSEEFPQAELYNPYYIYDGDNLVGYIGFNIFTPPQENLEQREYHKAIWPVINAQVENYTLERLTDKFEAGYCTLSDGEKTAAAVLCYNKELCSMAGIVLAEEVATTQILHDLSLSLSFLAC